ncbi:MAG: 16S rRNA (guanine(527)-N(7))-methyltransferase RsmG [Alphaproteobacteria bacterium]|nr:16S rRNA (guanine(527)-N(7))-methyltransferase RsmG [Alphaproteobacteria bacterium]
MASLGVNVSRETLDRLETLVATLVRWQKAINLVAAGGLREVWQRHVLDSAQLVSHFPRDAGSLVDLGSGGGFPGLVVAALRPDLPITLIEADDRKSAFLAEAARKMGVSSTVRMLTSRIEDATPVRADLVTARAVAPLAQLLAWAQRHRSDNAICLFHKGRGWRDELTGAMKDWDIPYQPLSSATDRDAVILRIGRFTAAGLRHRQPEGRRRQDDHRD